MMKKDFVKEMVGSGFIGCLYNMSMKEAKEALILIGKAEPKEIYEVADVILRSKDIVSIKLNGEKVYRAFNGKNKFEKTGDYLLHERTQDSYTEVFVNKHA